MNLPFLPAGEFDAILHYLLSTRGMDVDDAIDWIGDHYTEQTTSTR